MSNVKTGKEIIKLELRLFQRDHEFGEDDRNSFQGGHPHRLIYQHHFPCEDMLFFALSPYLNSRQENEAAAKLLQKYQTLFFL